MPSLVYNQWNYNHLTGKDAYGLYWSATDIDGIHRMFKLPYDEIVNILYILSKELNISYADMNEMPFFEILKLLEVYQENMKEQEKRNKKENAKIDQQMGQMQRNFNFDNINKQFNQSSNFSNGNFNIPDFSKNMPKI